jgi:hypothetical protein
MQGRPIALSTSNFAEILRFLMPVPANIDRDHLQSLGLSLGYALLTGMRQLYMLDNTETRCLMMKVSESGSLPQKKKCLKATPRKALPHW